MTLIKLQRIEVDPKEPEKSKLRGRLAINPEDISGIQEIWDVMDTIIPGVCAVHTRSGLVFCVKNSYDEVLDLINEISYK